MSNPVRLVCDIESIDNAATKKAIKISYQKFRRKWKKKLNLVRFSFLHNKLLYNSRSVDNGSQQQLILENVF